MVAILGYQRYVDSLALALKEEFGSDVGVIYACDPNTTGNFEVTFVPTGELIHSKSTKGHGRCESKQEKDAIFAYVRQYIASQ